MQVLGGLQLEPSNRALKVKGEHSKRGPDHEMLDPTLHLPQFFQALGNQRIAYHRVLRLGQSGQPGLLVPLSRFEKNAVNGLNQAKSKFGGLEVSEAKRLRSLEDENAKLKKLLAEAMLDIAVLKDITGKKW